jgi:hypothetical protein
LLESRAQAIDAQVPQLHHLNVIKLRQWPRRRARECQPIRYRSMQAEFSPPRISGQRERNAGVTFLGTCPNAAGRIATSSSLKSGTGSNAGSSIKLKNVTVARLVQHRATFTSCDGNPQWVDCSLLLRAVAREVSNAVRLDCLCRRDVGIAAGCIALLELGKSAFIERTRQLRIESQPEL